MSVLDLFAGCGGATEGLAALGDDVLGVEYWADAAASHEAAGHPTIHEDVRTLDPREFFGYGHFHGSPPCTTFSSAGRGKGRQHLDDLVLAVKRVFAGDDHGLEDPDETTLLTLEPARWLRELTPETISFEQVRAVLPVWEAYAECLRERGYSVAVGLISAETLGVPQTRVRAWLVARDDGKEARLPEATHSRFYPRDPGRLDEGVAPWVTMADALGWGMTRRPHLTVAPGDSADPIGVGGSAARRRVNKPPRLDVEPSRTLTGESAWWKWQGWSPLLPATTVAGDPRISARGHHSHGDQGRSPLKSSELREAFERGESDDAPAQRPLRVEVDEALVLQGFRSDYPIVGTRTSGFKQVGNAVPPPVAEAVLRELRS